MGGDGSDWAKTTIGNRRRCSRVLALMRRHQLPLVALAAILISCSGEREWRDPNRVLMPAQANEDSASSSQAEASSGEPDDGRSSVAASGRRTVAEVDASRRTDPESRSASSVGGGNAAEVQSYGAAASPHEVKSVTATETRSGSQTAAIDLHRLHKELRPFRLGTRLLLRGLAVMPDESARMMWPRFSAAVVDYVAAVRTTSGRSRSKPRRCVLGAPPSAIAPPTVRSRRTWIPNPWACRLIYRRMNRRRWSSRCRTGRSRAAIASG